MKIFIFLSILILFNVGDCSKLEEVSDNDLLQIIKSNEFVVVLFAKKDCDTCDRYETQLLNLAIDIKESLNAVLVKAFNSHLTRLYNPALEPALVFFRHGIPMLYDGPINEDEIYRKLEDNKIPIVKELSDENFEHLTQAATGSTTGDWFILFYSADCVECQRFTAVWEAVGATVKNRVNVARVNKDTVGRNTAKRFKVSKSPEFIFIRQGKYYRYDIPNRDIKSLVSFAQEFYRNARAEKIELPSTPFDNLVMWSVEFLKSSNLNPIEFANNYSKLLLLLACISLVIFIWILQRCCKKSTNKNVEKKAK